MPWVEKMYDFFLSLLTYKLSLILLQPPSNEAFVFSILHKIVEV